MIVSSVRVLTRVREVERRRKGSLKARWPSSPATDEQVDTAGSLDATLVVVALGLQVGGIAVQDVEFSRLMSMCEKKLFHMNE